VNELKSFKKQKIRDDQIRHLALFKDYVIVSADDDFVKSYVDREVPQRLIYIYGLDNKKELMKRMEQCVIEIKELINKFGFIEVTKTELRTPFN
jgi:predicted nuclease of predicted toxin-antitoxin system